jgi:uncharacterized protein (TIGR00369 family)
MNQRVAFFKQQIGKDKWAFDYPLMDWLHARVLEVDEDHLKMQFSVEAYMLNPIGILHGGITATMLDELMGAAGFLLGRPTGYATVNMHVDYLRSAKLGDSITGEGRVIRAGKSVIHTEARLFTPDEKLIAKASSNLIATSVNLPI